MCLALFRPLSQLIPALLYIYSTYTSFLPVHRAVLRIYFAQTAILVKQNPTSFNGAFEDYMNALVETAGPLGYGEDSIEDREQGRLVIWTVRSGRYLLRTLLRHLQIWSNLQKNVTLVTLVCVLG